jgi:hypothetical protein
MTHTPDSPEYVPGQLDLVPDAGDLDAEDARLSAELERVKALRMEHTLRAVSRVAGAAADWRAAGEELDAAVAAARAAGATWQQIADAAGMRRQSAWTRWGKVPDDFLPDAGPDQ